MSLEVRLDDAVGLRIHVLGHDVTEAVRKLVIRNSPAGERTCELRMGFEHRPGEKVQVIGFALPELEPAVAEAAEDQEARVAEEVVEGVPCPLGPEAP